MSELICRKGRWLGAPGLLVVLAITLIVVVVSWPVPGRAAENAPDQALIDKGREVFLTAGGIGCTTCHGPHAEGDTGIGPNNRGVGETTIRAALSSVEAMKQLREQLTDAQIKQIAAYYQWLGQLKLIKTLLKRDRFVPDQVDVYPGTRIQLVINNASATPRRFASDNMGINPVTVEGRQAIDLVWEAPNKESSFTLLCADCELKDQKLTINVTTKAPRFVPAQAASEK